MNTNPYKEYFVYGLLCPLEMRVKYIGCTRNLKKRETGHFSERNRLFGYTKVKNEWVKMLSEMKLRPIMVVFRKFFSKREAFNYESELVFIHRSSLTNKMHEFNSAINAVHERTGIAKNIIYADMRSGDTLKYNFTNIKP